MKLFSISSFKEKVSPKVWSFAQEFKANQIDSNKCDEICVVETCFDPENMDLSTKCIEQTCGCQKRPDFFGAASAQNEELGKMQKQLQDSVASFFQYSISDIDKAYTDY